MLLDSNIFIYAVLPEQAMLRERLLSQAANPPRAKEEDNMCLPGAIETVMNGIGP